MTLVTDEDGAAVEVLLALPSTRLRLRAWEVAVGRVRLLLLDSNVEGNRPEDRAITRQLYEAGSETRLRQEIVLGRGGVAMLDRLGIAPSVFHMNEGHAAFLSLERVGRLTHEEGYTYEEAREFVRATTIFTTHTPVPAGHDRFGEDLMRRHFSHCESWVGLTWDRFFALGQSKARPGVFNMTLLALEFASVKNGVSELHGRVSQELLREFWPGLLPSEIPITSVTNGVHLPTWTHPEIAGLVGASDRPVRGSDFERRAADISIDRLWSVRRRLRQRFLARARQNLEMRFIDRHESPRLLASMLAGLDENALLIGFARRFAPYKRAELILRDLEALARVVNDELRPVRIFFAGKAHPSDHHGLEILANVAKLSRSEAFRGKVFFLEGHNIELARTMVQGVDVWLNTPIRRLEASGTSGMKAAANGVLNLSVPDGWWCEGYNGENGWSLDPRRVYDDQDLQDELDCANLFHLLEGEVAPLFFDRDMDGVPRRWLERAKKSLVSIPPVFDAARMVAEYDEIAYTPLAETGVKLARDGGEALRAQSAAHARIRRGFPGIEVTGVGVSDLTDLHVGDLVSARAEILLGELTPDDVLVELVIGRSEEDEELSDVQIVPLDLLPPKEGEEGEEHRFGGSEPLSRSGRFACGIRVRPRDGDGLDPGLSHLALWA